MSERQDANRELVRLLSEWVEKYPDMRFGQILRNAGFVYEDALSDYDHYDGEYHSLFVWRDEFTLEPTELLKRVRKA